MLRVLVISLVLMMSAAPYAFAEDGVVENAEVMKEKSYVEINNAYAYATIPVQKNGGIFLTIKNDGEAFKITAAKADVAERVELHTHIHENGVMKMREVEAFDVPAGGDLTLEPHGHHVMLFGLKSPLVEGEVFSLTLVSDKGDLTTDVMIIPPGTKPEEEKQDNNDHEHHGQHKMDGE